MNMSQDEDSNALYSLEKNSGSGRGVTNFKDQAQIYTGLVHIISRLISNTS